MTHLAAKAMLKFLYGIFIFIIYIAFLFIESRSLIVNAGSLLVKGICLEIVKSCYDS